MKKYYYKLCFTSEGYGGFSKEETPWFDILCLEIPKTKIKFDSLGEFDDVELAYTTDKDYGTVDASVDRDNVIYMKRMTKDDAFLERI